MEYKVTGDSIITEDVLSKIESRLAAANSKLDKIIEALGELGYGVDGNKDKGKNKDNDNNKSSYDGDIM